MVIATYCNPRGRLEGSDSSEWQKQERTGLHLARASGRQAGGQGRSCLQARWKAGLQSLPPGLEMHDWDVHRVPALSTLGLGSRKLCLAPRVPVTLLGAEEQASDFLRQKPTQVAGSCPLLLARGQLGHRAGLLLMHHHLSQTLFPDT